MASILRDMWDSYNGFVERNAHPRTRDWFLIQSMSPTLIIVAGYLYFCLYAGPRFMKHRKPFELKNTLMLYNFLQILVSVYLFYQGGVHGWFTNYNYKCQPVDYSPNPPYHEILSSQLAWLYYFCKLTELLDTVFFILRKKDKQVTTLHLYHHSIMPIVTWAGVKFIPGGHSTFSGWLNAFVHIFMYIYYLLAGLGPRFQKYLWWKKHMTILQLAQFCLVIIHDLVALIGGCDFPKPFIYLGIFQGVIFIYMFGNFYYQTYIKKAKTKSKKQKKTGDYVSMEKSSAGFRNKQC